MFENLVKVLDFEKVLCTARLALSGSSSFSYLIDSLLRDKDSSLESTESYFSAIGLGNTLVLVGFYAKIGET